MQVLNKDENKRLNKDHDKKLTGPALVMSLVKGNAKIIVDREGYSRDLMRCARRPLALSRCQILAAAFIYTNAFASRFAQQNLCSRCHCIHAAAFTLNSTCIMIPSLCVGRHSGLGLTRAVTPSPTRAGHRTVRPRPAAAQLGQGMIAFH